MKKIGYGDFGFPLANTLNDNFAEASTASKYYTAFISQTGTNAPVVTSVLKDTVGSHAWARTAVGTYTLTKVGAFTSGKTVPIDDNYVDQTGNLFKLNRTSVDVMTLLTYAAADTAVLADDVLSNRYINIEIYA